MRPLKEVPLRPKTGHFKKVCVNCLIVSSNGQRITFFRAIDQHVDSSRDKMSTGQQKILHTAGQSDIDNSDILSCMNSYFLVAFRSIYTCYTGMGYFKETYGFFPCWNTCSICHTLSLPPSPSLFLSFFRSHTHTLIYTLLYHILHILLIVIHLTAFSNF